MSTIATKWIKIALAVFVCIYFLYYTQSIQDWHFIDNLNLVIHEAGHVVFMPFGTFFHILGGSLLQVLVPLIFSGYFLFQRSYFSASLVFFWVGQNLVNVSVYARDAIAMELPLLGGDAVEHDWHVLLSMTHTLQYTQSIAQILYGTGLLCIIIAGVCSIYFAWNEST